MVELMAVEEPRRKMTAVTQGEAGVSLSWGMAPIPLGGGPLTTAECVGML